MTLYGNSHTLITNKYLLFIIFENALEINLRHFKEIVNKLY